jgi:FkbM family methyltransferase
MCELFNKTKNEWKNSEKIQETKQKLELLHQNIKIIYGSLNDEYDEQLMALLFIDKNCKVLEIGGNIGRNSCIISSILSDSKNLVVLESDPVSSKKLEENRNLNNFDFQIENSALSLDQLYQCGWVTYKTQIPMSKPIKCIKYNELLNKYKIDFDTLVLDCEGAFYYILNDFPEILNNIKLIIVENDYTQYEHFISVHKILEKNKFINIYTKELELPVKMVCKKFFYQVYKKTS